MKTLIPLLLLLVSTPTLAKRQFDIEVILFKRSVDPAQINESWPNNLPPITLKKAGSFADASYLNKKGVTLLPKSAYQLDQQAETLQEHAGYTVLLHTAWRQGDEGSNRAPIFHIQAGKDYSDQFRANGHELTQSEQQNTPSTCSQDQSGLGADVQEHTVSKPIPELDGTLQVYVQHYLYVQTDLDLKEPTTQNVGLKDRPLDLEMGPEDTDSDVQLGHLEAVSPTKTVETFLKPYRMDQKRRMRSGETHYLDHPLMGMIIQVRKVKS
ncbi:MAG: peptidoglycan binding protein CsiV [Vibrio sp.]